VETLAGIASGTIQPKPQSEEGVTFAPILSREDGRMNFASRTARELYNRWRGFEPWPGAFTSLDGKKFIVHCMALPDVENIAAPNDAPPGQIYIHDHRMFAACAGGTWIELIEVQLEGKKRMSAADFLRGMPHGVTARLG
jgi:methionyl-tRNA formyltransferase